MLSAVAGTFNLMAETNVTVVAPPSHAAHVRRRPGAAYQDITTIFDVAGWAVDIAAPEGTGVDGVHVWAYPTAGGAPVWVGAAQLGLQRLDVSGTFGHHRFSAGGYFLQGTLPRRIVPTGSFCPQHGNGHLQPVGRSSPSRFADDNPRSFAAGAHPAAKFHLIKTFPGVQFRLQFRKHLSMMRTVIAKTSQ